MDHFHQKTKIILIYFAVRNMSRTFFSGVGNCMVMCVCVCSGIWNMQHAKIMSWRGSSNLYYKQRQRIVQSQTPGAQHSFFKPDDEICITRIRDDTIHRLLYNRYKDNKNKRRTENWGTNFSSCGTFSYLACDKREIAIP